MSLAQQGQGISTRVNDTLSKIIQSVGKVTELVAEIAQASADQSVGIEQANKAMVQIDQGTQLSAANAEESSSAAEQLASQSQELAALVQRFELGAGARTSQRPLPPRTRQSLGVRTLDSPPDARLDSGIRRGPRATSREFGH